MKKILLNVEDSYVPLVLRIFLSVVIFPHGAQKLAGWFNGYGFEGTMSYFTNDVGLPWIIGVLVIIIEFFGPIFILVGLATRVWCLAMLVVMAGIIVTVMNDYFFMNWEGTRPTEGFEFFLLVIGMSLALIVSGGGRLSLDSLWVNKKQRSRG